MLSFSFADQQKIHEIVESLHRAVKYVGLVAEDDAGNAVAITSAAAIPLPPEVTHRHMLRANTIDGARLALTKLRESFALEHLTEAWDEIAGRYEIRFLASPQRETKTARSKAPEVSIDGKRTPYGLACAIRAKISADLKLAAEIDRIKPDFQIVITDNRGLQAQMWMHENTGNWQIEDAVDCDALAERLKSSL